MKRQSRSDTRPFGWSAVLRALGELALARLRHLRLPVNRIEALNRRAAALGRRPPQALPGDAALAACVGWTIPRVARLVPWRADCLPQALAAQRWLLSRGVASTIVIGVERKDGTFNSHAWLLYGDTVVTGGEVAHLEPIIGGPGSEHP